LAAQVARVLITKPFKNEINSQHRVKVGQLTSEAAVGTWLPIEAQLEQTV